MILFQNALACRFMKDCENSSLANIQSINLSFFRNISPCESGNRVKISIRPANDSVIRGSVSTLAEPVSKNLPGRLFESTSNFIAGSRSGTN